MSSPPTLVVLGAWGDLAARLLLPGLAGLVAGRRLDLRLVGCDRTDVSDDRWRDRVQQSFAALAEAGAALDDVVSTRVLVASSSRG